VPTPLTQWSQWCPYPHHADWSKRCPHMERNRIEADTGGMKTSGGGVGVGLEAGAAPGDAIVPVLQAHAILLYCAIATS
jgi:hypothetical protein